MKTIVAFLLVLVTTPALTQEYKDGYICDVKYYWDDSGRDMSMNFTLAFLTEGRVVIGAPPEIGFVTKQENSIIYFSVADYTYMWAPDKKLLVGALGTSSTSLLAFIMGTGDKPNQWLVGTCKNP